MRRGSFGDGHEERALADIFVRSLVARTRDAEIVRHRRPVSVLADDDEALLGAQDHQRLEPEKPAAERRQLLDEARAQRRGAACRNRKLVGAIAGEAHARDPERRAIEGAIAKAICGRLCVVERDSSPQASMRSRERGPVTVSVAHCAVAS